MQAPSSDDLLQEVRCCHVSSHGKKSVFMFDQPRGVEGTALLIQAHK
jgi:hypothetical protein